MPYTSKQLQTRLAIQVTGPIVPLVKTRKKFGHIHHRSMRTPGLLEKNRDMYVGWMLPVTIDKAILKNTFYIRVTRLNVFNSTNCSNMLNLMHSESTAGVAKPVDKLSCTPFDPAV